MLEIKVVGPGCPNCEKLYQLCHEVVLKNEIDAFIDKVTDRSKFTDLGIWMTPGLIINNKVISQGKIPTKSTLINLLNQPVK